MLQSLSIADVVLIERLELSFEAGLGVLTGETGAGKSILLDALGLALGMRAETRLVRHGAKQAAVSATFDLSGDNNLDALLDEHGLAHVVGLCVLDQILEHVAVARSVPQVVMRVDDRQLRFDRRLVGP